MSTNSWKIESNYVSSNSLNKSENIKPSCKGGYQKEASQFLMQSTKRSQKLKVKEKMRQKTREGTVECIYA